MSSSESSNSGQLFEESPSSSPRGRGSSSRGRRGRAGTSTSRGRSRSRSGSRGRARGRGRSRQREAESTVDVLTERDEKMKEEIASMDVDNLRQLCLEMVSAQPGLVFNIMHPSARQPGGYHPPPGVNLPGWCVCTKCREMPTEAEKLCCGMEECITSLPNFNILILDDKFCL